MPAGAGTRELGQVKERRPKKLGRYEIRRELGRGTMGVVYEAQDPMLHRRIALKAIRFAGSVAPEEREHFERRFLAEARAVAVLSHPGIVVVHDVGTDEETDTPYIAMEFLEGRTLEEVVASGRPMPWREALDIAARAAWALQHAHERGIVHRDVKPANIMLPSSGQPKLMDFGIARLPASQLTAAGDLFGTPAYMSPEQASGNVADARSDIFSLGCVLYRLLSGKEAFEAESVPRTLLRVREETPPPPSRWVEGLPPGVDVVVARCMAKGVEERYPDARSLAEDIEAVLEERPPRHAKIPPEPEGAPTLLARGAAPATAPPARAQTRPRARRRGRGLLLGVAGLMVAGAVAALTIPWRGEPLLPLPTLAPAVPPAHLELLVEHPLSEGTVRVWIDGDQVLGEALRGRVSHEVLSLRTYTGSLTRSLAVTPGEHVVRVRVEGGDFGQALRVRGTFESGATRRLEAKVSGLISKKLTLSWASSPQG